jgi:hypothetical protein
VVLAYEGVNSCIRSQVLNTCDYVPPAVGYIDAISPREQATAMVARKVIML